MKKIMILYKDGTVKSKKEKNIDENDIQKAKYFLISVSPENECYTIIKPSKYLLFSKAIVEYQLCVFYTLDDLDDVGVEHLQPVRSEVTSICDMIGLLNSVDRLSIPNYLMNSEFMYDFATSIGVSYFRISLFDKNNDCTYDSYYELKGINSPIFDPYQVIKHFKDIYTNTIVSSFFTKNEFLYLHIKNDSIYWKCDRDLKTYSLIGIMLPSSHTITFLLPEQYHKLLSYKYMEIGMCIYYEKNNFIAEMSEMIANGNTSKERNCMTSKMTEVYFDDYHLFSVSSKASVKLVEVISNIVYLLNIIYIAYSELYDAHVKIDTHDFDVIMTFILSHNSNHVVTTEFSINRYSVISISDVLNNLN